MLHDAQQGLAGRCSRLASRGRGRVISRRLATDRVRRSRNLLVRVMSAAAIDDDDRFDRTGHVQLTTSGGSMANEEFTKALESTREQTPIGRFTIHHGISILLIVSCLGTLAVRWPR